MQSQSSKPLTSLLDHVDQAVHESPADLKSILESFGDRAFGPVLTICGLFLITPLGAIPGVPLALSLVIISFSLQLFMGRTHPWTPNVLSRIRIKPRKIRKTKRQLRPWLSKADGFVRPRMQWLASPGARYFSAFLSILLAASLLPLGAVPFGVFIPGLIICVLGLGIMARDGLLILMGYTLTAMAALSFTALAFQIVNINVAA